MPTPLLIAALILYILSLVAALVLFITGGLGRKAAAALAAMHGLACVAAGVLLAGAGPAWGHTAFLLACCSGVVLAGPAWRLRWPSAARLYFTLYLATLPVFLYSPSLLVRLITFHAKPATEQRFRLADGLVLERQKGLTGASRAAYKVIRPYGLFHKTLERDLDFGGAIDSVQLLEYRPDTVLRIRGYVGGRGTKVVSDLKVDGAVDIEIRK